MRLFRRREIDAQQELDEADEANIEGARGRSLASGQSRVRPAGLASMVIALAILCMLIFGGIWWIGQVAESKMPAPALRKVSVGQVVPDPQPVRREPDATFVQVDKPEPPVSSFDPTSTLLNFNPVPAQQPTAKTSEELLLEQRLSSGFTSNAGQQQQQVSAVREDRSDDGYAKMLRPTHTAMAAARLLGDLDYIVTKGTPISCTLDRRIVTTQAGPVGCYVTAPVMSASGRVALLDAGSEVTGLYRGGLTQGQASIFVLWERVRNGKVVIDLDSPGAGAMGQSGLSGHVDTHFWERFGSTIMLSLISDFGQSVTGRSRGNGQSIQFGNTAGGAQDAASEALKNSINIAPTLYKNEGERVNIILARDLDFSSVYRLESR